MSPPTSQADFPPDQTPKFSQKDEIRQDVELLRSRDLDSKLGNTHQITNPDTQPHNGQNNGTIKRRIQDHPQGRAYLVDRPHLRIRDNRPVSGWNVKNRQGRLFWYGAKSAEMAALAQRAAVC